MNTDEDFEVGQEWGYQTRPQEPNSSIVIGDIEDHPDKGTIIHISVVGVRVQNPRAEGGYFTEIGHIPVSQDSLQSSVTELLGSGVQIDGVAEGISTWREAEGGVFTISVAEAVQCIEDSLVGGAISEE